MTVVRAGAIVVRVGCLTSTSTLYGGTRAVLYCARSAGARFRAENAANLEEER